MATMLDVSRMAGVSKSTVSRVRNGTAKISESVITSYSIHYTKLYEPVGCVIRFACLPEILSYHNSSKPSG